MTDTTNDLVGLAVSLAVGLSLLTIVGPCWPRIAQWLGDRPLAANRFVRLMLTAVRVTWLLTAAIALWIAASVAWALLR